MSDAKQIATDWDIQELSRELRDGRPSEHELERAADYLDQLREIKAAAAKIPDAANTLERLADLQALLKLIG